MTPIVVDPNTPIPTPPDTSTSEDGIITATFLPGTESVDYCRPRCQRYPCDSSAAKAEPGGVFLTAKFPWVQEEVLETNLLTDPSFEYGVGGFTGPGRLIRDDAHVRSGAYAVRVDPTGDGTTYETRFAFTAKPDTTYTFSAWQWVPEGTTRSRNLAMGQGVAGKITYNTDPVVFGEWQYVTLTNSTATETGTMYVHLYGGDVAGQMVWYDDLGLVEGTTPVDFSGDTAAADGVRYRWTGKPGQSTSEKYIPGTPQMVDEVRFVRINPDGSEEIVRGGDPAQAVGGIAYTFDGEAPIGEGVVQWYAIPIYADGTEGKPSKPVALTLTWPDSSLDCWIKPLNNLTDSVMAQVIQPVPQYTYASRHQLSPIQGSRYQAGGWDLHLAPETTFTFWTPDCITRQQIVDALTQGPIMLQCDPDYQVPESYWLPGDLTETPMEHDLRDPGRVWTVPLVPIERPATADTPTVVLGRSYADTHALAGTYEVRYSLWPRYADVTLPDSLPADSEAIDVMGGSLGGDDGA